MPHERMECTQESEGTSQGPIRMVSLRVPPLGVWARLMTKCVQSTFSKGKKSTTIIRCDKLGSTGMNKLVIFAKSYHHLTRHLPIACFVGVIVCHASPSANWNRSRTCGKAWHKNKSMTCGTKCKESVARHSCGCKPNIYPKICGMTKIWRGKFWQRTKQTLASWCGLQCAGFSSSVW